MPVVHGEDQVADQISGGGDLTSTENSVADTLIYMDQQGLVWSRPPVPERLRHFHCRLTFEYLVFESVLEQRPGFFIVAGQQLEATVFIDG